MDVEPDDNLQLCFSRQVWSMVNGFMASGKMKEPSTGNFFSGFCL